MSISVGICINTYNWLLFIGLFPATQLTSLINSTRFFHIYHQIFYIISHIMCKWQLSLFPAWVPLISLYFCPALAKLVVQCWTEVVTANVLVLLLKLGKLLSVCHHKCPWALGLTEVPFIMLRNFSSTGTPWRNCRSISDHLTKASTTTKRVVIFWQV